MTCQISTSSIGIMNAAEGYQSQKMPLRACLGEQYTPSPFMQTMQIDSSHLEGAGFGLMPAHVASAPMNAPSGPAPRINRQMSGRSSNSSPKNQFGF